MSVSSEAVSPMASDTVPGIIPIMLQGHTYFVYYSITIGFVEAFPPIQCDIKTPKIL